MPVVFRIFFQRHISGFGCGARILLIPTILLSGKRLRSYPSGALQADSMVISRKAVNDLIVEAAVKLGLEDGSKPRVDTTVVETFIIRPTTPCCGTWCASLRG